MRQRIIRYLLATLVFSLLTSVAAPTNLSAAPSSIAGPTIDAYLSEANDIYLISEDSSQLYSESNPDGYHIAYSTDGANFRLIESVADQAHPETTYLDLMDGYWMAVIRNLPVSEYSIKLAYVVLDPVTNEILSSSEPSEGISWTVTDASPEDSDIFATDVTVIPNQNSALITFDAPPVYHGGVSRNAHYVYSLDGGQTWSNSFTPEQLFPINAQPTRSFTINNLATDTAYDLVIAVQVDLVGIIGPVTDSIPFGTLQEGVLMNMGDVDVNFGSEGSINVDEIFDFHVNVDRIATDSEDRILVLASYVDLDTDFHILFRLNADGTYDETFGDQVLNNHNYFFVTTTCICFSYERVDLEIDSNDNIYVLLSGAENPFGPPPNGHHSFIIKIKATGVIDEDFGTEGRIGAEYPVYDVPDLLLSDIALDAQSRLLVAGFSSYDESGLLRVHVLRYTQDGILDDDFGDVDGEKLIDSGSLINIDYLPSIRVIPDDAGGYLIPYTIMGLSGEAGFLTGIFRLNGSGQFDLNFALSTNFGDGQTLITRVENNQLILERYVFTDIFPDGADGFLVTGTAIAPVGDQTLSIMFRLNINGTLDTNFGDEESQFPGFVILGTPNEMQCFNLASFSNYSRNETSTAIITGDFCAGVAASLQGFAPSGGVDTRFGQDGMVMLGQTMEDASNIPSQLVQTRTGKLLVLSGSEPTNGLFPIFVMAMGGYPESTVRISRYILNGSSEQNSPLSITPSRSTVNGQVGVAITPLDFTITGGTSEDSPRWTWNPELPAGLGWNDGQIVGIPTTAGTTSIIFTATDFLDSTETATTTVQFVITLAAQRPTISGPSQITGTAGTAITPVNLTLGGGTSPETVTVTSGFTLPTGLNLSSAGRISGTPSAAGTTTTRFTVTDSLNETATATIQFVISVATIPAPAPVPIPYLKTLTTPKLNLKDGNLMCTPGTYNTGYTLAGVIQGSPTTLFTPTRFIYNLLINGITQTTLSVTTANTFASWTPPVASSGALISCSVTISANGQTNTDKSTDNSSAISAALLTQTTAIAAANAAYPLLVNANSKAYQKALVDNRAKWRSDTEKIRSNYFLERDRIKALPSTKATRGLSSAALKAYTTAQRKSAADYKDSKPAALAARDAANKAALDAKNAAIAKANAVYGTFIESIGYGVLIP